MLSVTVLLPIIAFSWGFLAFTLVGLFTVTLVPGLRLTVLNLFVFVAGALAGAFLFLLLYLRLFAGVQLTNAMLVAVGLVGGELSGTLLVWLRERFVTMTHFQYVDFHDVPRTILLRFHGTWIILESLFDKEKDEYEAEYSVFLLPESFQPVPEDDPWTFLENLDLHCVGKIPVSAIRFDGSKRRRLDASILEKMVIVPSPLDNS